jgi:oligopeptide/dipeptide ABC transporter ATP-binding protein
MTVQSIVGEPLRVHTRAEPAFIRERVGELLERVGLSRAYAAHYPHEFSGGQRQRVGIARALALNPDFIVCDEPVSALDVSVQAQIINLLCDIQRERGISYLFIAHDLSVVEHISHEVAVMYMGRIVERAARAELYGDPIHPYTCLLLAAVPSTSPGAARRGRAESERARPPVQPATGCPFHPRCAMAEEECRGAAPELREVKPGHWVSCARV